MNKQPEITDATRNRIKDSFWELYKATPLNKITVNMVSEKSGIHRSSFYRYYTDVYGVLEEIEKDLFGIILQSLKAMKENRAEINLEGGAEVMVNILVRHSEKLYYLLGENGDSDFRKKFVETIKNLLFEEAENNSIENADYYVNLLFSNMLFNFDYWYEHKEKYTFTQVNTMGQRFLFGGIQI